MWQQGWVRADHSSQLWSCRRTSEARWPHRALEECFYDLFRRSCAQGGVQPHPPWAGVRFLALAPCSCGAWWAAVKGPRLHGAASWSTQAAVRHVPCAVVNR